MSQEKVDIDEIIDVVNDIIITDPEKQKLSLSKIVPESDESENDTPEETKDPTDKATQMDLDGISQTDAKQADDLDAIDEKIKIDDEEETDEDEEDVYGESDDSDESSDNTDEESEDESDEEKGESSEKKDGSDEKEGESNEKKEESGEKKDKSGEPNLVKKHKFRSGTVALREIRKYQKSTSLLIPSLPFERLVRDIAQDYENDLRFTEEALKAIQSAAETYMTETLSNAERLSIHRGGLTLEPEDLALACLMRDTPWRL